ncbi:MAG TPA: hypothetical protein VKH18_01520 [Terriglobales bacterium]|nr:hypothetical protein [Terriglobales bacterium]
MHELSMLWELGEALPDRPPGTETSALLESFAVHLRNLIEFFFFAKKGAYVRAQDFFEDPTDWPLPQLTPDLKRILQRANNEVSHLTESRISGNPPSKGWDTATMVKQIEIVARRFALKASGKRLEPKVREFLGLPSKEMRIWIGNNVSHSNIAVQDTTSTYTSALSCAASTATVITTRRQP